MRKRTNESASKKQNSLGEIPLSKTSSPAVLCSSSRFATRHCLYSKDVEHITPGLHFAQSNTPDLMDTVDMPYWPSMTPNTMPPTPHQAPIHGVTYKHIFFTPLYFFFISTRNISYVQNALAIKSKLFPRSWILWPIALIIPLHCFQTSTTLSDTKSISQDVLLSNKPCH